MSRASLFNMKLSKTPEENTITFNDVEVKVKQYLPAYDKIVLVESAVRSSLSNGMVDNLILDFTIHFAIIEYYTNLNITDRMKDNILDTYDMIQMSGLMEAILNEIPQEEYLEIHQAAVRKADKMDEFAKSAISGYTAQVESHKEAQDLVKDMMSNNDLVEKVAQASKSE